MLIMHDHLSTIPIYINRLEGIFYRTSLNVQLWETSANIEHDLDIEAINCTRFLSLTDQSAFILGLPKHLHFKRKRVYDTF